MTHTSCAALPDVALSSSLVVTLVSSHAQHVASLFTLCDVIVGQPPVAAETAFTALDTLARCVIVHGVRLETPKSSALVLTACVSLGWKLTSRDAAPHQVALCWNRLGLHGPGVHLDTREVIEQEMELLVLLRFHVCAPVWWEEVSHLASAYVVRMMSCLAAQEGRCPPDPMRPAGLRDLPSNGPVYRGHIKHRSQATSATTTRGHCFGGESPYHRNSDDPTTSQQRRFIQSHCELLAVNIQGLLLEFALFPQQQQQHHTAEGRPPPALHQLLSTALDMSGILPFDAALAALPLLRSLHLPNCTG